MLLPTAASVLQSLRDTPLLRADDLARIQQTLPPDLDDTQEIGKWLIRQGYLTLYQARKLIQGKASELVVGPYILLDKIGEGGMGKVYKAVQQRIGRTVALKVVVAQLLANITALRRFQRESRAAAQLSHPNIVRVYDAGQDGDTHFIAMEFVEGDDLSKLIKANGPMPVSMTCNYMRQAALGLQHAHTANIIHRDIKPGNLLVDKSGVLKILDMGLARPQFSEEDDSGVTALTQAGTVVGTPDFMAPEQAKNSSTVDHRADLYSLGCTWYYLLTGRPVFATGTTLEKLLKHQMDSPPSLHQFRQDVPIAVEAILWKLLAKNPADRWQSASELADALGPMVGLPMPPQAIAVTEELPPEPLQPTMQVSVPRAVLPPTPSPFSFAEATVETPSSPPFRAYRENRKPRPPRLPYVLIGGFLLLLTLGVVFGLHDSTPTPSSAAAKAEPKLIVPTKAKTVPQPQPPTEIPFDRYFPDDSSGLITIRTNLVLESELIAKELAPDLAPYWKFLNDGLGFDPKSSTERISIALSTDASSQFLMVVQGKFANGKLTEWLNENHEEDAEHEIGNRKFTVHQFAGKVVGESLYLSIANPTTLLGSPDEAMLLDALKREATPRRGPYRDPMFQNQVGRIDRNAAVWGIVTGKLTMDGHRLAEDGISFMGLRVTMEKNLLAELMIEGRNRRAIGDFMLKKQGILLLLVATDKRLTPVGEFLDSMTSEEVGNTKPILMRFRYEWEVTKLANWLRTMAKSDE